MSVENIPPLQSGRPPSQSPPRRFRRHRRPSPTNRRNPFDELDRNQNFPPLDDAFRIVVSSASFGDRDKSLKPIDQQSTRTPPRLANQEDSPPSTIGDDDDGISSSTLNMSIGARAAMTDHLRHLAKYGLDGDNLLNGNRTTDRDVNMTPRDEEWYRILDSSVVEEAQKNSDDSLSEAQPPESVVEVHPYEECVEVSVVATPKRRSRRVRHSPSSSDHNSSSSTADDFFNSSQVLRLQTPEKHFNRTYRVTTRGDDDSPTIYESSTELGQPEPSEAAPPSEEDDSGVWNYMLRAAMNINYATNSSNSSSLSNAQSIANNETVASSFVSCLGPTPEADKDEDDCGEINLSHISNAGIDILADISRISGGDGGVCLGGGLNDVSIDFDFTVASASAPVSAAGNTSFFHSPLIGIVSEDQVPNSDYFGESDIPCPSSVGIMSTPGITLKGIREHVTAEDTAVTMTMTTTKSVSPFFHSLSSPLMDDARIEAKDPSIVPKNDPPGRHQEDQESSSDGLSPIAAQAGLIAKYSPPELKSADPFPDCVVDSIKESLIIHSSASIGTQVRSLEKSQNNESSYESISSSVVKKAVAVASTVQDQSSNNNSDTTDSTVALGPINDVMQETPPSLPKSSRSPVTDHVTQIDVLDHSGLWRMRHLLDVNNHESAARPSPPDSDKISSMTPPSTESQLTSSSNSEKQQPKQELLPYRSTLASRSMDVIAHAASVGNSGDYSTRRDGEPKRAASVSLPISSYDRRRYRTVVPQRVFLSDPDDFPDEEDSFSVSSSRSINGNRKSYSQTRSETESSGRTSAFAHSRSLLKSFDDAIEYRGDTYRGPSRLV